MSFLIAVKNGVGNTRYCYTLQRQTNSEQDKIAKPAASPKRVRAKIRVDWKFSSIYLYYNNLIIELCLALFELSLEDHSLLTQGHLQAAQHHQLFVD